MKADINNETVSVFLDYNKLLAAGDKCKKGKMWKDSVAGYMMNQLKNTYYLKQSCLDDTYKVQEYTTFTIYEPKKREIQATRFNDRILQKSIIDNYWYDAMTRGFIKENCACQKDKGTGLAREILKSYMLEAYRHYGINVFIQKGDVTDFFGSTPKATICNAINKRTDNIYVKSNFKDAVYKFKGKTPEIGVGLGSEVTQISELAVLDDIDHLIKEKLKIKYYIRYMDDFILIHPNKEYLRFCKLEIIKYLNDLGLKISKKKTQIFKITQPVKFLGFSYRITNTGKCVIKCLPEKINREKRKLRKQMQKHINGEITAQQIDDSYKGFRAGLKFGNNHSLILKMDKFYKEEWEKTNEFIKNTKSTDSG